MSRAVALALLLAAAAARFVAAQAPAVQLARGAAALDSARVEDGVALLTRLVRDGDSTGPVRAGALQLLAAARWWSDDRDSARALLRQAAAADLFVLGDTLRFSPDLMAAYAEARREVVGVQLRTVADTTVRPDSATWPVGAAVGRSQLLRWRLAGPGVDTVVALARADSVTWIAMPLRKSGGEALDPGAYRLMIQSLTADSSVAMQVVVSFTIARLAVDTVAHPRPPSAELFRPESRRGSMPKSSILRGALFGIAAVAVPMLIGNGKVGGGVGQGAIVAAGGLALAGVLGASAGRPVVTIDENVRHNRALGVDYESRLRSIIASNERSRRFAPVVIRTGSGT